MTQTTRLHFATAIVKRTPTVTVVHVETMGAHKDIHVPHWVVEPRMWAVGDFMRKHRQLGGYLIEQTSSSTFTVAVDPQRKVA